MIYRIDSNFIIIFSPTFNFLYSFIIFLFKRFTPLGLNQGISDLEQYPLNFMLTQEIFYHCEAKDFH
jgi:hypothetical protein